MTDLQQQLERSLGSTYRLERELGGGGMARVFIAEELRLRRKVVIKVFEPTVAAEINASRFEREIEFAAQLQHPQIVPLFATGDADGVPFYTMPFIEGESLGARLARGTMSFRETIDVLRDVAKALSFAHARGVVHRDIKPTNILLAHGSAVVTDFGIAKAIAVAKRGDRHPGDGPDDPSTIALTQVGTAVGTPTYMAPEQIAGGDDIDHRADIYSLGCVAYEMLAGAPPFEAVSLTALFGAHLTQRPVDIRIKRPDIPPSLTGIVMQCLEKEPVARPRDAADLIEALDRSMAELSGPVAASSSKPTPPSGKRVSVAVLPFKDLAGDSANEHLGIGLADAAITDLASVKALLVRPTSAILPYRNRTTDALQIGRELSVDAVVDGSFQRAGNRLRVTVQLIDAKEGSPLWGAKLTTSLDDVFVMQDEVSHRIVEALELELTRSEEELRARAAPIQGDAQEDYFRGRVLLFTESLDEVNQAIEWFKKALERDPSFAKAYLGLADAYARIAFTWVPDAGWYERAEEMVDRALAMDPRLPEGRYLRGRLLWAPKGGFDHAGAMREFMAAVTAQPSLNEAHHWLGILLLHLSMFEESTKCFDRALAISPHDRIAQMHTGYCAYLAGRFEDALAIITESGKVITSAWTLYSMALAQIQLGLLDAADRTTEEVSRRFPGDVLFYPLRALSFALRGNHEHARQQIELTIKNEKAFGHYHHAQYDVACVYAQLGEADQAIEWLSEAGHNGFPCAGFFERDPLLQPIHSDERFRSLIADMTEECARYAALYHTLVSAS